MIRRISVEKWTRRCVLAVAGVPLALLTGCPQENAGAPGKVAPQSTAPAVSAAANAGAPTAPAKDSAAIAATPGAASAQAVDIAANAYKAQQLINDAERMYRSGVDNYRAG